MNIQPIKSLKVCLVKDVIIGIFEHEKTSLQPIEIEISISFCSKKNLLLDEKNIIELVENSVVAVNLLERLAYIFLTKIVSSIDGITFLSICIKKPKAIKNADYSEIKLVYDKREKNEPHE